MENFILFFLKNTENLKLCEIVYENLDIKNVKFELLKDVVKFQKKSCKYIDIIDKIN